MVGRSRRLLLLNHSVIRPCLCLHGRGIRSPAVDPFTWQVFRHRRHRPEGLITVWILRDLNISKEFPKDLVSSSIEALADLIDQVDLIDADTFFDVALEHTMPTYTDDSVSAITGVQRRCFLLEHMKSRFSRIICSDKAIGKEVADVISVELYEWDQLFLADILRGWD
ncbi:hypothetical protein LAZ67_20002117 [Cordylochernes scorpioides]|uniref:Uncharacterized protein n=1 Tax=Cordylochernes scorpioides TaxID=51811 RepID=A0ABY6LKI8_9ARAC|nr:hypothetical protein LAZ67_20002117 [Cordylochernes scorpioides]